MWRGSSVGIVTRLGAGWSGVRLLVESRELSLLESVQTTWTTRCVVPMFSVDHSLPSGADIRMSGSVLLLHLYAIVAWTGQLYLLPFLLLFKSNVALFNFLTSNWHSVVSRSYKSKVSYVRHKSMMKLYFWNFYIPHYVSSKSES